MKKKVFTLIVAVVLVVFVNNMVSAIGYPTKVNLPYTFSPSNPSGSIDINGDGDVDFYIIFQELLGGYNFKIYGVLSSNFVLAEYVAPTSVLNSGSPQPLAIAYYGYTSILPFGTEIIFTGVASPLASPPSGTYWTDYAYIVQRETGLPPIAPLGTTAQEGAYEGYIGINFETTSGHYNGWLHVVVDDVSPMVTILSAGMGSAPNEPVAAGAGDPYASSVPVPLIASLLGLAAIGSGIVIKRRKKK